MNITKLQTKLGYTFKNITLLAQALTHKSCNKINYERLEFVGDGILDYVVALNLFQQYPHLSEGELSKMRASLVNQEALVEIAFELELGQHLYIGDGEEKSHGRNRHSILADSVEAIFAAISFDSSFEQSRAVIERLYKDKFKNVEKLLLKDSKSLLQELLQARKIDVPIYTVLESTGPDHASVFNVECEVPALSIKVTAKGKSKKEASQFAAEKILELIHGRD